ncbi:MAG: hypothetical protein Q9159_001752 [Coniocarpon cinnabarinum]
MSSQKRMRTQSSAVLEPDNHKRRELSSGPLDIAMGGTLYDHDEPENKPMPAKDREKLGVSLDSAIYCSYEITPLYPSFFRQEVIAAPPPGESPIDGGQSSTNVSPSPAAPNRPPKYNAHVERLYICETCFRYTPYLSAYMTHVNGRCANIHAPPGQIVYLSPGMPYHPTKTLEPNSDPRAPYGDMEPVLRKSSGYALYEIDGDEDKLFCQNLSLFAKLWVESKSVGFDVGGFTFYVLVEMTAPQRSDVAPQKMPGAKASPRDTRNLRSASASSEEGSRPTVPGEDAHLDEDDVPNRIVGYFSKEKNSWDNNNLACILVFPPWQGQGVGQLLIEASYYLGEREGRFGGPERRTSSPHPKKHTGFQNSNVSHQPCQKAAADPTKPQSLIRLSEQESDNQPTILDVANDAWIVPDDVIATLKRMDWAEGLLANGDEEKAQRLVVDRKKAMEYLSSAAPQRKGLEKDGWLFDDSSGESSSTDGEDDSDEDEVTTDDEEVNEEEASDG